MLDNKTKNILYLNDIKEVMVATMLCKYTKKELSKSTLSKFARYMNKLQKKWFYK